MTTLSPPRSGPPPWPYCGHGADPTTDPIGCHGLNVPGHNACLAHITKAERITYLANLTPGADIDHRGTPFTESLLDALLHALMETNPQKAHLGTARFDEATFSGNALFDWATFSGNAVFKGVTFAGGAGFARATFSGNAVFEGATFSNNGVFDEATFSGVAFFKGAAFSGDAYFKKATFSADAYFKEATFSADAYFEEAMFSGNAVFGRTTFSRLRFVGDAYFKEATFSADAFFGRATFSGDASFDKATFSGIALFEGATFSGIALFDEATFSTLAVFGRVTFSSRAVFDEATFSGNAEFYGTRFVALPVFGPLTCTHTVDLSEAVFEAPVTMEIAAAELRCERTRWAATATLRLRYTNVDLSDAVFSAPVGVTAHPAPFARRAPATVIDEQHLKTADESVKVTSVRGVDAAHLVLSDIDLSECVFTGAFHLDQLRLGGRCTFALTPPGVRTWRRVLPYRWSRRRTLAEEHHWRALATSHPGTPRAWRPGPHHPDRALTPGPEDVAATYRQLRKAFEDGKDQPGAADFYYGEMEMRRHGRHTTTAGERVLLWAYWLISGYGLRALRAIAALLLVVAAATVIFGTIGFARSSTPAYQPMTPSPGTASTAPTYRQIEVRGTKPGWGTALYHAIDSSTALLHTPGTEALTATGRATEIALRLLGPVLLGLAALAVRGRLKR